MTKKAIASISKEILSHFSCEKCSKWWSVSEAPVEKSAWYCPWCGYKNVYSSNKKDTSSA